jgi:DNA processing protein
MQGAERSRKASLLSDRQRRIWLRLIRSENVGPATFRALINRFGSAEEALEALPELAERGGRQRIAIPSWGEVDAEMEAAERMGARFVAIGEEDYPPLLSRADNPPPLIAIKGRAGLLSAPAFAVVGARNASVSGAKLGQKLANQLGSAGFLIVSGLARGIDTAAHRGSLESGTVAVIAGGLDQPYPPENIALYEEIAERGVVLSEMPFGWVPRAQDFPRRNRIVAGMSYGLLVVEAAERSGSLISARLANEMGRLVFAVPGSPLDPRSGGANRLLKDGAILVTRVEDITEAMIPLLGSPMTIPVFEEPPDLSSIPPPDDDDRSRVVEALGPTPASIDELIRHTGLEAPQIALVLLELDLAGRIERHSGGFVSLLLDP